MGNRTPDLLDANESTWAFVAVYSAGRERYSQVIGFEPLANEGSCLNYCGRQGRHAADNGLPGTPSWVKFK